MDFESDPLDSLSLSPPTFFDRDRHVMFLQMMYQLLPYQYQTQEINRLTLAYFVISGLHLLRSLNSIDKEAVANWVLSFQARPKVRDEINDGMAFESCFQDNFVDSMVPELLNFLRMIMGYEKQSSVHNGSQLASTYCVLAILKITGYDLSNIDSDSILTSMRNLQQPDGSLMPFHIGAERDLQFIYCAAAISSMLENWGGMDREKAKEYILNCQSYDGGFGLIPGSESHGGATYCPVAALQLMGFIEDDLLSKNKSSSIINLPLLLDWSLQAADGGFQGRPNKDSDTCYACWIGAVLRILGGFKFIDDKSLCRFLLTCQSESGVFSKFPGQLPGLYLSYYGYTAFSLLEEPCLNPLCVELGIANFAAAGI